MTDQNSTISTDASSDTKVLADKKALADRPKGWKMTTLGEVAKILTGKTPPTSNIEFYGDIYPFITPTDIDGSSMFCATNRYLSEQGKSYQKSLILPANSICYTCIASIGKMCVTNKPSFTNQQINTLIVNNQNDWRYIYYLLKYKTPEIHKLAGGTTTGIINKTQFSNFEVTIAPLPEQRAIAAVLSSLDDKIELLCEQNKTLEATAQAIFKEWFVNFNFPGTTGKMIDSELGKIPEGWRVLNLKEIVESINGYSYKGIELKEKSEEALVTLKSFDRTGGFQVRGFKPFVGKPKNEQEVFLGDLVVAHTDLTQDADVLGNPAFIFDGGGYKRMFITMDLVKVISKKKEIENDFFYYLMRTRNFKRHCVGYSNGTTVLHLSKRAIPEYKVALPNDLILVKNFSSIANSTTKKIISNFSQIQTLSTLRDNLLPKLMKGEVRVGGFEN